MSMASEALSALGLWITRKERKDDRDDSAVRSVLDAVTRTQAYIARKQRGEPLDRDVEQELSRMWTAAAVAVRRSDAKLAGRLQEKAEYWANPENWTAEEIVANGIRIDDIAAEGRRLLQGR